MLRQVITIMSTIFLPNRRRLQMFPQSRPRVSPHQPTTTELVERPRQLRTMLIPARPQQVSPQRLTTMGPQIRIILPIRRPSPQFRLLSFPGALSLWTFSYEIFIRNGQMTTTPFIGIIVPRSIFRFIINLCLTGSRKTLMALELFFGIKTPQFQFKMNLMTS